MALDGYIRVSRVAGREGESFISPKVQREQIEQWAKLRGVEIAEWHEDLDVSGGKLVRPGLDAVMARIRSGETGGVAVAKLDRLSRAGVGDALKLVEEIHQHGGQLAAVDLGIDPTTAFGEFGLTLMLGLGRMERRRIAESWDASRERAVARGVHVASRTPTGYVRRDDGTLKPHPKDAPVIGDLFRLRATGAGWGRLAAHLNKLGVVGPYRAPNWTPRAIQHIIENRVYLGEARSGEYVNPDAHEPLIDRATWEAAQQARGATPARSEQPAVLAGLLRCAGCRHLLKPDRMRDRDGSRIRFYRCRGEHSTGRCQDRAAVLERVALPVVEREFFRLVGDVTAQSVERTDELERLALEAADADAELAAYRDDERILGALGQDRFVQGLQVRAEAADAANERLGLAQSKASVGMRADLAEFWPGMGAEDRKQFLGAAFDAVVLRSGQDLKIEDRLHFVPRGEAPDDLPRRGKRFPLRPFDWPA